MNFKEELNPIQVIKIILMILALLLALIFVGRVLNSLETITLLLAQMVAL